jgi:proteasome lid subunit RPN8/RPN11
MAGSFGAWSAPGSEFAIEYSLATLEEIRQHALEGFYSMPRGGAEVAGLLLGTRADGKVRILAKRIAPCEHAFGPALLLSAKDEAAWSQLLASVNGSHPMQAVGWYHSHTRSEICLTDEDLAVYERFFPELWQVALVVRPDHMGLMRAGFFLREADGSVQATASHSEFSFAPLGGAAAPLAATAASAAAAPRKRPNSSPERLAATANAAGQSGAQTPGPTEPVRSARLTPASANATEPARLKTSVPSRPVRRWSSILAVLLGLAAVVAYIMQDQLVAWWVDLPVELRVQTDGRNTAIRWNPAAPKVQHATGGSLQIEDGASSTAVVLDRDRLRRGSVAYQNRSDRIEVRLILRQADGRTVVEFAGE